MTANSDKPTNSDKPENVSDEINAGTTSAQSGSSGDRADEPETLTGERSTSAETGDDTLLPTPEPTDGGAPAP